MGNRAVITDKEKKIGVYLHWNGGRDSVEAFLKYCKLRGFRTDDYGWARLCQVIGNFFGGGLSLGIGLYEHLDTDNGDNGVYVIEDWEIVDRLYMRHDEQQCYNLDEMVREIDSRQPESEQLGDYLDSIEVPTCCLRVGDMVWMEEYERGYESYEVVGFGEDGMTRNGFDVSGLPYVNRYLNDGSYANNRSNYVLTETCRIKPR